MVRYGDRVTLSKDSQFYNLPPRRDGRTDINENPKDMKGIVQEVANHSMFGFNILVRWENETINAYTSNDLEVIDG